MIQRKKKVVLVLVPALLALAGCSYDPSEENAPLQRDVYTKVEDCIADWGNQELCAKIAEAEAAQFAQSTGVTGGGGSHVIFWGPSYYPGTRSVYYGGQTYAPTTSRAMSKPFSVHSASSSVARASPGTATRSSSGHSSGSVGRGGFGSSGHSASSGSSGG